MRRTEASPEIGEAFYFQMNCTIQNHEVRSDLRESFYLGHAWLQQLVVERHCPPVLPPLERDR